MTFILICSLTTHFICPYYFNNHLSYSFTLFEIMLLNIGALFLKKGLHCCHAKMNCLFTGLLYEEDSFLEILML